LVLSGVFDVAASFEWPAGMPEILVIASSRWFEGSMEGFERVVPSGVPDFSSLRSCGPPPAGSVADLISETRRGHHPAVPARYPPR
jgi:hypothetical protein